MRNPFAWLLDIVAPPRCPGCGDVCPPTWCAPCGVPRPIFDGRGVADVPIVAAGAYEGALARAITRFKYEPRPELALPLARLLIALANELPSPADATWVPVPLHFARLVERGFNQSALLARELQRATRRPTRARLLRRHRDTSHQAELGRAERAANVRDAFEVRGACPGSVVLVDDVVTTGATAEACIAALRKKGVRVQAVLTLARTSRELSHRGPSPRADAHDARPG